MHNITPELLRKYFKGHCTPQEEAQVAQWLAGSNDAPRPEEDVFSDVDKTSLRENIWQNVRPTAFEKRSSYYGYAFKIAASVLILLVAGIIRYIYNDYHTTGGANHAQALVEYKTIKAARGKKMKLTLADGSIVHLNAESELIIPIPFSDTARSIHLLGEAFLEVTKDATRPFTVTTPGTTVKVLGTVFNVRAYPGDASSMVTVQEGKVRVSDAKGQNVLLIRNQAATHTGGQLLVQNVYADNYTAWRENKLVFKDQPLSEIALTLQRWYNIQVLIKNKTLAAHRFTGRFDNPTINDLLKDMSAVVQFNYSLTDKKLIMY